MRTLNASIQHIEIPERMRALPISGQGYPIPWFVAWINGKADFRVVDTRKIMIAIRQGRCWLCGGSMGRFKAFVIGPMCAVNRTSSEPPSHRDCAEYAVGACPFLTKPRMRRNAADLPEHQGAPGIMLDRNPGVVMIWMTRSYNVFRPHAGNTSERNILFRIGPPTDVVFYSEGRRATREEIMASIDSGLPKLRELAEEEGAEAVAELDKYVATAMKLVPAA
jgi:hypothetical protein